MNIIIEKNILKNDFEKLFLRPAQKNKDIKKVVEKIVLDIKLNGDYALKKYADKFDKVKSGSIKLDQKQINRIAKQIDSDLKLAINVAYKNIYKFHSQQLPKAISIKTMKGVKCERKYLPIKNVGLYIPGGSAVLFSTLLMLGIPAKIAGCKRIVVCSPIKNEIHPALAYCAQLLGINEFYSVGGAHSIAMMAYGTSNVKKVDKIFGPGNQYVTTAKSMISIDSAGCVIDMPAGPSEVLIIADKFANPKYVAADLLSQAEHGADSQVILLTNNKDFAKRVITEIENQLTFLSRKEIAEKCLQNSSIIVLNKLRDAFEISNKYAPEHLILNLKNVKKYLPKIKNAGSVFIGSFSPESVGDYASGTNHSLPTYGYAKSIGGVSVESFMKTITFQELTQKGLKNISKTVIKMAEAENLDAHANAVKVRLENGN